MKNNSFGIIIISIFTVVAIGCGKKGENPVPPVKITPGGGGGADVYAVGTTPGTNVAVATYWKNGFATPLGDNNHNSVANGIVINGENIWVFGNAAPPGQNNTVPVYWKNGVADFITGTLGNVSAPSQSAFAVDGTDVYLTGSTPQLNAFPRAAYWRNGVTNLLPDNGAGSVADGIAFNGTDLYVFGYSTRPAHWPSATYWKNGIAVKLTDSSALAEATGMAFSGSDMYIVGYAQPVDPQGKLYGSPIAMLWKNGIGQKLTDATQSAYSPSIVIKGNDIYVGGYVMSKGILNVKYWKNGTETLLDSSGLGGYTGSSPFVSITFSGSDMYIAAGQAGYWKNGQAVPFPKSSVVNGVVAVSN